MYSSVHSINLSAGGVPKLPENEALITVDGLVGDRQRNRRYHGGPMRAVCLYSLERIALLREEGHPIEPGSVGENLTVTGLDWDHVVPGVRLSVGAAELEITSFTKPCKTIRNSFVGSNVHRIAQDRFPGWSRVYAKVLKDAVVRVGDAVKVTREAGEKSDNLELFRW
jgi:MOSC domain-containing protein YiiM